MKVDELMADIREGRTFGPVRAGKAHNVSCFLCSSYTYLMSSLSFAVLYTVEFQKRGLPHIHCRVWLAASGSEFNASTVDGFICAEIPDLSTDPLGYALVDEFMIHGPCGHYNKKCPCMREDKCSKIFPKSFQVETTLDDFGFTIYKRRDDGRHVVKNGVRLVLTVLKYQI